MAEEDGGNETDGRERRGAIDPRGDPQAQSAHEGAALVIGVVLRIDAALREQPREGDRLIHADGDASQAAAQHLGRGKQRLGVFLLLLAAEELVLVAARFRDFFVRDGDRHENHVGPHAGQPRFHLEFRY